MNKIQISETVNSTSSIINFSNTSENLISLSQINPGNIQSTIITSKLPQETPLSTKGNVKSYCRIRPNHTIYSTINKFKTENNNKTLIVDFTSELDKNNPSKQFIYKYNFTEIFWTSVDNQEIYEKVCKQSIQELFSMHKNALIFVYGITNSGKTYTVNGNMKTPGILQLSLISLFKEYKKLKENNDCWQLSCTYIEIYNEEVFDLLSKDRKKIKIVGGGNKFYSQGNIIKTIESVQDFTEALNTGENNRTKAETNANPYSSRSHSIFRVELSYQDKDGFCFIEPVSLCIVDLAGAERVSKSGVIGTNLKEAGNINSSLLVLKKCFDAMEANSRTNMVDKKIIVPVRESKLTMLFKEYFAAHQNISVICTINPDRNELMDIRSVLNFGAKAMKVKPVKSWIPTYNYSSKEVSPNKTGSRGNSPFVKDTKKKYRLLTEKKYLEKKFNNNNINNNNYNNHYLQNSSSRENVCKVKEDNINNMNNINTANISNDFSSKKKIMTTSSEKKLQNIKILKYKKHEYNTQPHVLTLHNENAQNIKISKDDNKTLIEERMKCYNNPFQLVTSKTNNFFMKNSPSKEKLKMEKELKEKRDKEIKDKISKNKEDIKNLVINIFNKKMYYKNLEQNIDIYEKQCRNIDLNEVEALLAYNNGNNFYSLKNPFAKIYEEDKHITLSKSHPINLAYFNVVKEKILKNENNINISFKPSKKNQNLEIISNYNIGYLPERNNNNNNEFDIFRGGKELIEELQLKLNNSDHDQSKIMEFLDKSFEQYNASQFKAYFGIGKSLVKKLDEGEKDKNIDLKKGIEMIDKIDKAENDENINFNMNNIAFDFLSNEYNFKGKGKDVNNNDKKEISKKSKNDDDNKEINEEEKNDNDDNDNNNDKEDKKKKKKNKENKSKGNKKTKKRGKKKKITENDSDEEKGDESDNYKEKEEIKSKDRKKKRKPKKGKSKSKEKEIESEKKSDDEEKPKEDELSVKDDEEKEEEEEKQKDNSKEEDSDEDKEIEIKSRKRKKNVSKKKKASKRNNKSKKRKKAYNDEDESEKEKSEEKDDNISEEEEEERRVKKNKKKRRNKKKKIIESDIDSSDDLSEENENIKPIRKKKTRSKKYKK